MDILTTALHALWQVLVVGILLGAGLPALFALGIRALNTNRTVVVAVTASNRASSKPSRAAIATASIYEWEQTRSQGLVIDVDHPLLGYQHRPRQMQTPGVAVPPAACHGDAASDSGFHDRPTCKREAT